MIELLDDPGVSAGDLNSCFVALNLTYLFELVNTASLLYAHKQLKPASRRAAAVVARFWLPSSYLYIPLGQLAFLDALSGLSKRKLDDAGSSRRFECVKV